MHSSAGEFSHLLRSYLDILSTLVRECRQSAEVAKDDWPESGFLAALVTQGFRGVDGRAKPLLTRLAEARPYSVAFTAVQHNPQAMEPLTGADLAVVVELKVDNEPLFRRVILVQLKTTGSEKAPTIFPHLHHRSGASIFGEELHQAQRMLLFTDSSVYWLSLPLTVLSDERFAGEYTKRTNLAVVAHQRSSSAARSMVASAHQGAASFAFSPFPFADPNAVDWEEFWHYWRHYAPGHSRQAIEKWKETALRDRREVLLSMLRAELAAETWRLHGMRSRLPVIACHAESVLALSLNDSKDATNVFSNSVPLAEFILGHVLCDGFGDENEQLITSLSKPKPDEYIRQVVRDFAGSRLGQSTEPPVRAVVELSIAVQSGVQDRG